MKKLNSVGLVDRREKISCYCSAAVLQRLNLSSFGIYGFGIEPYKQTGLQSFRVLGVRASASLVSGEDCIVLSDLTC